MHALLEAGGDVASLPARVLRRYPHLEDVAATIAQEAAAALALPELAAPTLHSEISLIGDVVMEGGAVRRALADAGFDVTRCPGYGTKRHMSVGRLGESRNSAIKTER